MGDKTARHLPGMFIDRGVGIQQIIGDGIQQPALGIADHIAVNAATGGGGGQANPGQNPAIIIMHRQPARDRRVILVKLHSHGFRQVPAIAHNERLAPGAKDVGEKFAMVVHIGKR